MTTAIMKGKGTAILPSISSVYTALPLTISIDKSGEKSKVFKAPTLDGTVHPQQPNDGYVENPTIKVEYYLDRSNTVHTFLYTSMRTPPAAGVNFKITYTDTAPTSEIWNCTGIGIDEKVTTNDGVKATLTLETSGEPT
jgi:hypothetical protein